MQYALTPLLSEVIDYAGLFPPAALPMAEAAAEYTELIGGPNRWLLRRFVCPINWLDDLLTHLPPSPEDPWSVSVLGTSWESFRQDIAAIERFEEASNGRALVEGYEVKATPKDITRSTIRHLADAGFEEVYAEFAWGEALAEGMHALVQEEGVGVKVRTGGLEAGAFPSAAELAAFIREAISLDLPFKCTAGLHHAMPYHDPKIGARHHGFLNALLATALAVHHDLSAREIERILDCENPESFWFTERGAGFEGWELSVEDIAEGREYFRSFGSCSVAEPVGTLADLGYRLEPLTR